MRSGLGLAVASGGILLVAAGVWRIIVDTSGEPPEATSRARFAPAPPPPEHWAGVAWTEIESPVFADPGYVCGLAADGDQLVAWGEAHPLDPAIGGATAGV